MPNPNASILSPFLLNVSVRVAAAESRSWH